MRRAALPFLILLAIAAPLAARDSLGVFGQWGAFRDAEVPRCYAIATAEPSTRSRDVEPFASIGSWPQQRVRGQLHLRLSRVPGANASVTLNVGGTRFRLTTGGTDAWAASAEDDTAIMAAMRAAGSMQVTGRDKRGASFTDRYSLDGAATAIDAALVGCARR